jgi:mercuric ion transport protein
MNDAAQTQGNKLLKRGIIGSLIAAVCCFTPLLVIAFVGVGLTSLIGGLDYVLFPILFGSLGLVAYALYLRADRSGISPKPVIAVLVLAFSVGLIWLEFKYALRISFAATAMVTLYGYYLNSTARRNAV